MEEGNRFTLEMEPKSPCTLITGAASGLGQEFMERMITSGNGQNWILGIDRNWSVPHKFARSMPQAHDEQMLSSRVEILRVDLSTESEITQLAALLDKKNIAIDCLIHCAGARGLVPTQTINSSSDVAKADGVAVMDEKTMISTFQLNAWASFSLFRAMIPALKRSTGLYNKMPTVIVMGSRMGSIGYNSVAEGRSAGGGYAYRASKAALNAIVKSFSIDVPDVKWLIVHPGRVETKIVSVKEDGAIPPSESVMEMMKLVNSPELFVGPAKFVDRFGEEIPW